MIKSGFTLTPGKSPPMFQRCGTRTDLTVAMAKTLLMVLCKLQMWLVWTTPRDGAGTRESVVSSLMTPIPNCIQVYSHLSTSSLLLRTIQVSPQWLSTRAMVRNGQKFLEVSFQTLTFTLVSSQEHGPKIQPQEELFM